VKKVIIRKTEEIENWRRNINSEINFIPTMGNLHNGHIKLISTAKNENSNVNLVSIFINPLQFDNKLDLENYPKTIDNDIKISFSNGADAIFIPSNEDIYPPNNKDIKSSQIGELILKNLRKEYEVAYIRYASVYRKFNGVKDFISTLESLKGSSKNQLASNS